MALKPVLAAALVFDIACAGSTGPRETASNIQFLAGNHQSDTIQATLSQALVTRVAYAATGQPVVHQIVQFISVADSAGTSAEAFSTQLTSNYPQEFTVDTTDASGKCVVTITLGPQAGRARLVVKVPALGFVDTAVFTVTAGRPAGIRSGPADTAVYAGHTATLHSAVADRFGNPRTDPVTYAVASGPATLSGSTVTVTAIGRVMITASGLGFQGTTHLSGVPTGMIAGSTDSGIAVFNLDGSGYKKILKAPAGTVVWAPSGTSIVFDQTQGNIQTAAPLLQSVTLGGTVSVLDNSTSTTGLYDTWPTYAANGSWIYYVKELQGSGSSLWRVHPDASNDAVVSMQNPPGVQYPSASPDGSQVAYIVPGPGTLNILDVSTGVSTNIGGIAGYAVSWSPTGNLIVYQTGSGTLMTVHPDGTGQTPLGTAAYSQLFSWSPDGKWVIAVNQSTSKVELLSVTSNLILPLGYTGRIASPSWH